MIKTLVLCATFGFTVTGCKHLFETKQDTKNQTSEIKEKFHVAVIDDGFDETLQVFNGKIAAKFTLKCKEDDNNEDISSLSFQELKRRIIAEIQSNQDSCELIEGFDFDKSPAFQEIRQYLAPWNNYYLNRGDPSPPDLNEGVIDRISAVLDGEEKFKYHGTNVASLIAYKNEKVELILIQKELVASSKESLKEMPCISQTELDKYTKLFTDPDVVSAHLNAPPTPLEQYFDQIMVKNNIDFVNTSFGSPPAKVIEQLYESKGCPSISYRDYYYASNELDRKREITLRKKGIWKSKALTLNAFGNDGLTLDSSADGEECAKVFAINVGALDAAGNYADFTNRGKCGDVYVPGDGIIVAYPEGFIAETSGTSFSSPLFVRYLTQTLSPQSNYLDLYNKLKGSNLKLTANDIPAELLIDFNKSIGTFSLMDRRNKKPIRPMVKLRFPSRLPFGLR